MAGAREPKLAVLGEIGRGGMGTVELCEEAQGEGTRVVARKTILPERSKDRKARSLFLKEARLLARIKHPNVVRISSVDEGDDTRPPSFTMEYVRGAPLSAWIAKGPLEVGIAARIARDVALGLHAAHELADDRGRNLGVVHRDVSPHNVVVGFDGRVTLLDFGVAKTSEGTRTQTGEVRGKVAYMAKEQALADAVDRRSDVCSLGAVLFEMLTGERLRRGETDLEVLRGMATEARRRVSALRPDVPPALDDLVWSMIDDDPDARPPTALAAAEALEPFVAGDVGAALGAALPDGQREDEARLATLLVSRPRAKGPRWVLAVPAVAAVVLVGALVYQPDRKPSAAPEAPAASSRSAKTEAAASTAPAASSAPPSARPADRRPMPMVSARPPPAAVTKVLIDPKPF